MIFISSTVSTKSVVVVAAATHVGNDSARGGTGGTSGGATFQVNSNKY